jgi:hypothetical protein
MTHERVIENQHFIEGIESRVTGLERHQARGIMVEPVFMAVAESEIDFIWPMSFEEDRIKLASLRTRLNVIRSIEKSRPEVELPPIIPFYGWPPPSRHQILLLLARQSAL